ncbi:hypothetical protein ACE6H2_007112 [Prunus campanulata]
MSTPPPQNVAWAVNVAAGSLGSRGPPNTQVSISRTYLCDSVLIYPSEMRRMLDATLSRIIVVSYVHQWFTGIKKYPQNSSFAQEEDMQE